MWCGQWTWSAAGRCGSWIRERAHQTGRGPTRTIMALCSCTLDLHLTYRQTKLLSLAMRSVRRHVGRYGGWWMLDVGPGCLLSAMQPDVPTPPARAHTSSSPALDPSTTLRPYVPRESSAFIIKWANGHHHHAKTTWLFHMNDLMKVSRFFLISSPLPVPGEHSLFAQLSEFERPHVDLNSLQPDKGIHFCRRHRG